MTIYELLTEKFGENYSTNEFGDPAKFICEEVEKIGDCFVSKKSVRTAREIATSIILDVKIEYFDEETLEEVILDEISGFEAVKFGDTFDDEMTINEWTRLKLVGVSALFDCEGINYDDDGNEIVVDENIRLTEREFIKLVLKK